MRIEISVIWMILLVYFCSSNHGATAIEIMIDTTLSCSLNKTYCFVGYYVEWNSRYVHTDLVPMPFRCVDAASRHLFQVHLPGEHKIDAYYDRYDINLQMFHNCTDNGYAIFFENNWKTSIYNENFTAEYTQDLANNGSIDFKQDYYSWRHTYPPEKRAQWLNRPPIKIQWKKHEDTYAPTRNFKYLAIGDRLVGYEEKDALRYDAMSNSQKLKRIEEERAKLMHDIATEKKINSTNGEMEADKDEIEKIKLTIAEKQKELEEMKTALATKISEQEKRKTEAKLPHQLRLKIEGLIESGNPNDTEALKKEELEPWKKTVAQYYAEAVAGPQID